MAVNFEAFSQFTPERRIDELQNLIEKLKKEIEERREEIKEAEHLLVLADEEARMLEQVEIPESKQIKGKIEEKLEEKEVKRLKDLELEELLATAPKEQAFHEVAHRPVEDLADELRKIYDRQKETGIEKREDREMLYAIRKGFEIKREEGYAPATAKDKHLMTEAEQWAEDLYKGGAGTYKRTPG
ncbi:Uncharacterised protein [uncultured archaeon]|nr:Uncharacterised protein [uncultured archaeon]